MDYRTVAGNDADDLVAKLSQEAKRGEWKVIGLVKDGPVFRAFLEGTAYEQPPPPAPPMSEWEQTVKDELTRIDREKQIDESDGTA